MTLVYAAAIGLLFTVIGLPPTTLLWSKVDSSRRLGNTRTTLALAPVVGLCVFAVFMAAYYAWGRPVREGVPVLWLLLGLAWLGVAVCFHERLFALRLPRLRRPRLSSTLITLEILLGLLIVAGAFAVPFVRNPDLVFWHYAGSDGYIYMRIAEHVENVGTAQLPQVDLYDGANGFLAEEVRHFEDQTFVDKPGTMATLAGVSAVLGRLPQETFSPLVLVAMCLLYLALIVFGSSIGLPAWLSPVFAAFGALSPAAWMIATHTFLGNALALPLFPLVLSLIGQQLSLRSGLLAGLALAAQTVVFPDGTLALVGMMAPYMAFLLMYAWRRRFLRRLLGAVGAGMACAAVLLTPYGTLLGATAFWRLATVVSTGILGLITGTKSTTNAPLLHQLSTFDWIWPAFNLNTIPPTPLNPIDRRYLVLLAALIVGFIGLCLATRRARGLAFYASTTLALVVMGVFGGVFLSDYELFRALAVFAFVPLAVVFVLPVALGELRASGIRVAGAGVAALMGAILLVRFAQNDRYHFDLAYSSHLPDAQYTAEDIQDRIAVGNVASNKSIVMSTETPSFTAFANVLMLFSQAHIAVPESDEKFVFFPPPKTIPEGSQYASDLVLFNRRYQDVWSPDWAIDAPVYTSDDFIVLPNELVPFFDNDTFPPVNGFPMKIQKARQMLVARALTTQTDIAFYCRATTNVRLDLAFDPQHSAPSLLVSLDGAPPTTQVISNATLSETVSLAAGLHRLGLGTSGVPVYLTSLRFTPVP